VLNRLPKATSHLEFSSAKTLTAAKLGSDTSAYRHSLKVAWAARKLAMELEAMNVDIDPDDLATQAILHDIGRGRSHNDLHGWEGYQLLRAVGYEPQARACLTHWLRGRSLQQALAESKPEHHPAMKEIYADVGRLEMELPDKIIALADSLVAGDTPVTLNQRYSDAEARYGRSRWLSTSEEEAKKYLSEIETVLGKSVYNIIGIEKSSGRK